MNISKLNTITYISNVNNAIKAGNRLVQSMHYVGTYNTDDIKYMHNLIDKACDEMDEMITLIKNADFFEIDDVELMVKNNNYRLYNSASLIEDLDKYWTWLLDSELDPFSKEFIKNFETRISFHIEKSKKEASV